MPVEYARKTTKSEQLCNFCEIFNDLKLYTFLCSYYISEWRRITYSLRLKFVSSPLQHSMPNVKTRTILNVPVGLHSENLV